MAEGRGQASGWGARLCHGQVMAFMYSMGAREPSQDKLNVQGGYSMWHLCNEPIPTTNL